MKSINNTFLLYLKPSYYKFLFFTIAIIFSLIEAKERNDFTIYQMAASDVVNHINPYAYSYIDGYYYYYSLFFAYIIYPFTYINAYWVNLLWLLINFYFLYLIIRKISKFLTISTYPIKTQLIFYILLILFNIRTIRENYHAGQVTILILFLMTYSLHFLWEQKNITSALLLALAINIKLLAIPLLVYYIYRAYWKTSLYTLFFVLLFFILPLSWMKTNFYLECINQCWKLVNPNHPLHILDVDERSFHSISTLITTLFMKHAPDIDALPIRRYILDLPPHYVKLIIFAARIFLISSALIIIRKYPFQKTNNQMTLFYEATYIIALIPLVFPHQQHYAFLLQLPSISILILASLNKTLSPTHLFLFIIAFLCFNLKILLGIFNEYYDHFKILTYGSVIIIFIQICIKPKISVA